MWEPIPTPPDCSGASGGVDDGSAVHAAVVSAAVRVAGLQAGLGRHQRAGHRAAVGPVAGLQPVVLRLGHELVDGERVAERVVVRVVVVRCQVRGLVQQQRVVVTVMGVVAVVVRVGVQLLRVRYG